ncbi:hypothetical protein D3C80_1866170 [compost metagenome]
MAMEIIASKTKLLTSTLMRFVAVRNPGASVANRAKTISSADGSAKRAAARRIEMIVVLSRGVVATDDILPVLPT